MKPLQPYHLAWLSAHPGRTKFWLRVMLYEGFDVHHIDGDHANNDPLNLVLIEHVDHMRLHGKRTLGRVNPRRGKRGPQKNRRLTRQQVDRLLNLERLRVKQINSETE